MLADKFLNKDKQPTDADLKKRLGQSHKAFASMMTSLQSEYKGIVIEWKYSKTSGWYITCNKGKKRLFYLFPIDQDFSFKMVFNDRSLQQIKEGSFLSFISDMLRTAKKYPEGTLFVFDKKTFKVGMIMDLLRIKIEN